MHRPWHTVGILAFTQITSWGSLYYAFSILAPSIGHDLALREELVYGAFSWSLLVAGLVAAPTGMILDRFGGQWVMAIGSALCGAGLIWLSHVTDVVSYYAAWTLLGVAMSLTLYEAAFATINRKFALGSRQAISTLTLFAGFASTIFWPLTLKLSVMLGWRDTYFWFGMVQLLICLPLHLMLGRDAPDAHGPHSVPEHSHTLAGALRHPAFWKLAMAFSANMFIFSALSVHLIPLLKDFGHTVAMAVLMSTLIGPMQVVGRICEKTFAKDATPQTVGKFTFAALPAAIVALLIYGSQAWSVALFCILYGLSNGILTIVRGTIPQAMFGRKNYGAISGAMSGPSLLAKAAGPLVAAAILRAYPSPGIFLFFLLCVSLISLAFYLGAVKIRDKGTSQVSRMEQ
ncbi:MFS transporter [Duganella sp. FT80W]|uniref:MFS transporter n=1 Tax=Duganella guangzhouensis TaxID=2666084 RepID=A0A6I2KT40_9BURK|nr:MFS transporter [Duganella guangzhouensis]MRW88410.1 MFS transporter [Duganella guangzhouensis]